MLSSPNPQVTNDKLAAECGLAKPELTAVDGPTGLGGPSVGSRLVLGGLTSTSGNRSV